MHKFAVFYSDGTEFTGNALKSDWKKIDVTKQITKLCYMLGNKCVIMKGFKEYNHCKEYLGLQVKGIGKILLMGRKDHTTVIIVFDLIKKKIFLINKPYGEEYGKQVIAGWKRGLLDDPKIYLKDIENVQ